MFPRIFRSRLLFVSTLMLACVNAENAAGAACVWKVSGPNGSTLYLGGSIHALKGTDYPLPPEYNRAFDASTRLVFEDDPKDSQAEAKIFKKEGQYPNGDGLKNHVDPRTYDYVCRIFKIMGIPENKFSKFRPWALVLLLQSPGGQGLSGELGVEGFLKRRAQANSKSISGLESAGEHLEVFSGLTDRQSEALLLITFIPHDQGKEGFSRMTDAWRRGDADTLALISRESFRNFPTMGERIVAARNRRWIPKIESYLRSGQPYFVVVGAAHMSGPDGILALLESRGYKVEQF